MRLPVIDGDIGERAQNVNEEEAIRIIRYGIDNGINYIDTAYTYNQGKSEIILGKALSDGYREKVKVATKIPIWLAKNHEDLHRMLDEQLERLQVVSIDMYLLHMLSHMNWSMVQELDVLGFLDEAREQGKIKYIGFSFHDGMHLFKEIIGSYNWDFCYIQLNYIDEKHQAGIEGLKYAYEKGLAVVVMEPLRGGNLVRNMPDEIKDILNRGDNNRTPAELGFRWVCNHPEVSVVLSGMSDMDQLKENLNTFDHALPNSLSVDELKLIEATNKKRIDKL
jgi:predicted aldo/keto reductase-like oxidoreductase